MDHRLPENVGEAWQNDAGTGGSWSDLMSCIDELVDE